MDEHLLRKYGFPVVLGITFLLLLVPVLMRAAQGAPITPGSGSYTYLLQAELLKAGYVGYDPLREDFAAPSPYTLLLLLMDFFGVPWLLPLLLALSLVIILHLYLKRMVREYAIVLLSLLILAVSPAMSVLGTSHSPLLLAMVFIGLALLSRRWAAVPLALAIITAPVIGLFAAAYFLFEAFRKHDARSAMAIILAALAAVTWFFLWLRSLPGFSADVSQVLFEFGEPGGISVFALMLAAYGLLFVHRGFIAGTLTALLLLAATYVSSLLPVAAIVTSVLAAHGVFRLVVHRWRLDLLRQTLIVLVVCLWLFLMIVSVRERSLDDPDATFARAMIELGNQRRGGAVLSDPHYAPMIEYFSGRRATLQPATDAQMVQAVLHTRDANTVYTFLESTGTSYIFVTDAMIEEEFSRSDEGILFLLQNSERFVQISKTQESALWYYISR